MKTLLNRVFFTLLAASTLVGCAATPAQVNTAKAKVANRPAQAQMFERYSAKVAVDYHTQLAILEITAKSLMTQFSDDAVSVFHKLDTEDVEQDEMLLFRGKIFLGKDGHLYLANQAQGSKQMRFYAIGTYEMSNKSGESVEFKLAPELKLQVRNRSVLPHGGQPFLAVVTEVPPAVMPQAPALVRGQ